MEFVILLLLLRLIFTLNINIMMMTVFRFDMEGEELYSVKWYKAGHEFYRYIPGDRSAAQ